MRALVHVQAVVERHRRRLVDELDAEETPVAWVGNFRRRLPHEGRVI